MTADPQDVFDEADDETSEFSADGPSTAVYLHQVKSELDEDWYQKEHKTQRIGAYRIKDKLGEGGMAQVYRAEQLNSDREVAVKVVSLKGGTRNDMAQQVFREASALAMIDHPNVISCFGFGEDKGRMYMALEILDGKDSHDLIEDNGMQPFSLDKIFDISLQAISGFQMVFKAGFIHRDIKPANIFVNNDGVVKVADLGLAWKGADVSMENVKSGALGTPSFMSPEQILDEEELDVRSDIYSMGATIFFYATGRTPFIGDDPMVVMKQALSESHPDMREFNSQIPEGLVQIVNKAMQKDRKMRYENWKDMFADLELVRDGKAPENAAVVNEVEEIIRQSGAFTAQKKESSNGLIIGIFVVIVAAVIGAVVLTGGSEGEKPDKDPKQTQQPNNGEIVRHSIFDLKNGKISGEASIHKDHISLNGGVIHYADMSSLINEIKASKQFSVEIVVSSANNTQAGPARIVTFSKTYAARNFTIAQNKEAYEVRVRNSTAISGLRPRFVLEKSVTPNAAQHLLFVREKDHHVLYLNGKEVLRVGVFGHVGNWDESFPMLLGNDIKNSSPWIGTIHKLDFILAEYNAADAAKAYEAWSKK